MARNIADIAYWVVRAFTSQVTGLAAVVASLAIGAVRSKMTWFVAVTAEPGVERGYP